MEVKSNNIEQKNEAKDYWGYAVCIGTAITFIAGIGHVNSFGLIYNDFMRITHSTAKSLTTANGVFSIMSAIGGIVLNILSKKMSLRSGGLIGALLFISGSFSTGLISNTNQLPMTFGILQGIGFGMMVPVSYSTLNYYFVKKRTTVMSSIKAAQGLLLMWYPQLVKIVIDRYGFRGTLLLISGISLHTLPGMLVMMSDSPKKKESLRTANNAENGKEHENVDLLRENNINDGATVVKSPLKVQIREKIMEMFALDALKDPVYRNICIGQSFANFSDLNFFVLLPMLLFQYGYDTSQVAMCITICAAADVAGRWLMAIISSISNINTRVWYYFSTLLTIIFRIVLLQVRSYIWVALVCGVLGVMRAWIHIASPLVISNHVTHKDFPGAYALFMLTTGVVNVSCAPLIGLLKDIYNDYFPAFYALTGCCLPCLVIWPIEYLIKK